MSPHDPTEALPVTEAGRRLLDGSAVNPANGKALAIITVPDIRAIEAEAVATRDAELRAALDAGWNLAHGLAIDVLSAEVPDGVREHAETVERRFWDRAAVLALLEEPR